MIDAPNDAVRTLVARAKVTATLLYFFALAWLGQGASIVVDAVGTGNALRVVANVMMMIGFPAMLVALGRSLARAAAANTR